jgi:hypothetical protein
MYRLSSKLGGDLPQKQRVAIELPVGRQNGGECDIEYGGPLPANK